MSPKPELQTTSCFIKPYNTPPFKPLGKVTVEYNAYQLEFVVMPADAENLLGFKTCRQLQLIQRVSQMSRFISRESFLRANAHLFQGVGKIPGKHKIYTDPKAVPKIARGRRFAYSLQNKLIATLREMHEQGVIEPVKDRLGIEYHRRGKI